MKAIIAGFIAAIALAMPDIAAGAGQFSTNYKIPVDAVNNGVGDMTSTSYKLSSSLGDAFFAGTAPLASTSYRLSSGFFAEVVGISVPPVTLTVATAGTGTGTVTSSPAGISCPGTCAAPFGSGSQVVLTAAPAVGSVLTGFAGCSSTVGLTCTVTSLTAPVTVTATFATSAATAPGAPTIGTATPGNGQASITFTPPGSNGGTPITGYTASCLPGPVTGVDTSSPITVTGLLNNTLYTCSVTATNAAGTSAPSATVTVTPSAGATFSLVSVQSRKVHGATGTYDIPIDSSIALAGLVTVEPRAIGAGHVIVFQFNAAVTVPGTVTVVDALAAPIGTPTVLAVGDEVQVTIPGVPDNKRVTVTLTGVNGTLSVGASIGFLVGDVNNSRSVTATDILQVKGRSGQTTDSGNYRYDLNASGSIGAPDILQVKGRSGLVIP